MNLSLESLRVRALPLEQSDDDDREEDSWLDGDGARIRRLRSLLSLFALYAAALLSVILLSDGADIGCILVGIGGHVLYASAKTALAWRDASWLEHARSRTLRLRFARAYAR
jgi:hypothetical protein